MITFEQLKLLGSSLARLGTRRLVLAGVVAAAVVAAVGIAAHYLSRPAMQSIYTGLSTQDVGRISTTLAEAGIQFDVNEQRNAVMVPFGMTSRARTLLAQKGLPSSSRAGYELFDQLGSMGLTSFMQEVTRVRALEGEIARTLQALDGVAAARVHLVLSEPGSFRRDRRDPSASVLLRSDSRWQPSVGQIVRHLVAAAVPGMKVEQVSVASTDGRMLAAGGDETALGSVRLAEMEKSMAAELEQRASRTLASALGSGNFQISISTSLDVDRQQTNETIFDPKSRVERSLRVVKQSGSSEDGGSKSATGVEANVPREEANQSESEKRRQREDRKEELVNYELNSKTIQTVREGYRIKSLAIAVVVNRKQVAAQLGGNPDADAIEKRLAELKRLVSAATGVRADREDRIEISTVDFSGPEGGVAPVPSPGVMDSLILNLGTIINAVAMLGVVLVVSLLGLRPLIKVLARAEQNTPALTADSATTLPGIGNMVTADFGGPMASIGPSTNPTLGLEGDIGPGRHEPDSGASKDKEAVIRERLSALVASNDAKVVKVMKEWIADARPA